MDKIKSDINFGKKLTLDTTVTNPVDAIGKTGIAKKGYFYNVSLED